MLQINGKTFMNLQEAVQWLLDNNALPFQSSANYIANTEIGMGTIVNPSPAKVRIGSLIFFADSKVSTVIGLTENGFICSDQYNNLADDVPYVTNVAINASGHLITTLSDGQTIDAGIIKQVSGFSIDGSQHLIVTFNDGTSTDLGAIFSGDLNVAGDLTVTNKAKIIEKITDANGNYRFVEGNGTGISSTGWNITYCKWSLSGSHLMCVVAGTVASGTVIANTDLLASFVVPLWVGNKIYPVWASTYIEQKEIVLVADDWTTQTLTVLFRKFASDQLYIGAGSGVTVTADRHFRIQFDLLIDNA